MEKGRSAKTHTADAKRALRPERTGAAQLVSLTVPMAEAKRDLSDLCARAGYAHETIVVTKHGRPIAAIISVEDLERSAALEDRYAVELLERAIATSPGTVRVEARGTRPARRGSRRTAE